MFPYFYGLFDCHHQGRRFGFVFDARKKQLGNCCFHLRMELRVLKLKSIDMDGLLMCMVDVHRDGHYEVAKNQSYCYWNYWWFLVFADNKMEVCVY